MGDIYIEYFRLDRSLLELDHNGYLALSDEKKVEFLDLMQKGRRIEWEICDILGCQKHEIYRTLKNEVGKLDRDLEALKVLHSKQAPKHFYTTTLEIRSIQNGHG